MDPDPKKIVLDPHSTTHYIIAHPHLREALAAEGAEEVGEGLGRRLGGRGQIADRDKDGLYAEVHVVVLDVVLQLQHGLQARQPTPSCVFIGVSTQKEMSCRVKGTGTQD